MAPALIAVDHEGGRVQRFSKGYFTKLPRANTIGRIYSHDKKAGMALCAAAGLVTAAELGSCGINLCLGPSLDLNTNSSNRITYRAYSEEADAVISMSSQVLSALKEHGMAAVGKHFPGFGAAVFDTHSHFPIIEESWDTMAGSHLRPFKAVIEQRLLPAVMLTHGAYVSMDLKPVAGSSFWLQEVLRQQMHYDGVIMTDCMGMVSAKPLGQNYSSRISNCMRAGCDIILISYTFNSMYAIIKKLINDEDLTVFFSSSQAELSKMRLSKLIEQSQSQDYYMNLRETQAYIQARKELLDCAKKYYAVLEEVTPKKSNTASVTQRILRKQLKPLIKWLTKKPWLWELSTSVYLIVQRLKIRKKYEAPTKS